MNLQVTTEALPVVTLNPKPLLGLTSSVLFLG